MIPKIIHFIWFGKNSIPQEYLEFINEWQKMMPDYEFIKWDEDNYALGYNKFSKEAMEDNAWAFVSDYVRIKILYEYGGIYLDIDEKVLQPLDIFLEHNAFFGQEPGSRLQAGVMGCEPKSEIFKKILDHYETLSYKATIDKNKYVIGDQILQVLKTVYPELKLEDIIIPLANGIRIYPSHYFCPDLATLKITSTSYTIHYPNGSWLSWHQRLKTKLYKAIVSNILTRNIYNYIKR